jgi:hypothetical protein
LPAKGFTSEETFAPLGLSLLGAQAVKSPSHELFLFYISLSNLFSAKNKTMHI